VALVTGGGSGIGRAIAGALARRGAAVAVAGRRREVVEEAAAAIEDAGGRALAIAGDVARPADGERMVAETVERFGALHLLVNNAGIARAGPLDEMSPEVVDALIDVDLKGPIHVTRAALPQLRAQRDAGGAAVINVSSSVTLHPVAGRSVYAAAKAGVDMLTRCWALDLAADRIRVNAICPGVVRTPLFATMMPPAVVERFLRQIAGHTPLGRVGEPDDVARLACFLADPENDWLTGAVIPLDGGLSLRGG
ncbi:MAG: SDR family oxidoreductase, partial [Acidobacteria bacterium]